MHASKAPHLIWHASGAASSTAQPLLCSILPCIANLVICGIVDLPAHSYLNYYHELYYELLTNFMGKGDKETFAYAMLSVGEPVHTVSRPTDALGIKRSSCELLRDGHLVCTPLFACNTMVQRDPGGGVLFLHSNLNKWTLDLPDRCGSKFVYLSVCAFVCLTYAGYASTVYVQPPAHQSTCGSTC